MKIGLGVALCVVVGLSVWGPPPRRMPSPAGLRSLLGVALILYVVGIGAAIERRSPVAIVASALGVAAAALAGWLSRAHPDGEDPPDGDAGDPDDGGSPAPGDHDGDFDWDRFDRERRGWQPQPPPAPLSPKASSCNRGSPLSSG